MGQLTLVIGNKNYSSWSLRPWILMKHAGIPFAELCLPLHTETFNREITKYSPSGRVPILIDGELKIWESISICEYLAERFLESNLWPEHPEPRALARSISAEMHAGFMELRRNLPMNARAKGTLKSIPEGASADIRRITEIWNDCRARYGKNGEFLFGHFTVADAMFAPVVLRFHTYGVKIDPVSETYVNTILSLPAMKEWLEAARNETESFPETDRLIQ